MPAQALGFVLTPVVEREQNAFTWGLRNFCRHRIKEYLKDRRVAVGHDQAHELSGRRIECAEVVVHDVAALIGPGRARASFELFLRRRSIPTIQTSSQKLSISVNARNVRNIVRMRSVKSMIEFKQIIGRGTRIYNGKEYFTVHDFVMAHKHFADPEWDGELLDP